MTFSKHLYIKHNRIIQVLIIGYYVMLKLGDCMAVILAIGGQSPRTRWPLVETRPHSETVLSGHANNFQLGCMYSYG